MTKTQLAERIFDTHHLAVRPHYGLVHDILGSLEPTGAIRVKEKPSLE